MIGGGCIFKNFILKAIGKFVIYWKTVANSIVIWQQPIERNHIFVL